MANWQDTISMYNNYLKEYNNTFVDSAIVIKIFYKDVGIHFKGNLVSFQVVGDLLESFVLS